MDDLISEFTAETREMLDALAGEVVAWEAAPGDTGRLDAIFRFVHTVKGNCGFFDLPRLTALSHAAEDALAQVRSGKRKADEALVSAVLAILDRIGELVLEIDGGEAPADDDAALVAALDEQAPAPAPALAATRAPLATRTVRLPIELLDRMMSGVSDLVLARNDLSRRIRGASAGVEVEAAFERVSACVAEMRDAITRTRMQRIDNLFAGLPRMVRDLAGELGKQVALEIEGGDVELDREMIEIIRDPLTHIVRNAIDHGIEAPAERKRLGKRPAGRLRVCARQAGNQILIEVGDDGRGIDGAALAAKAVANGTLSPERAAHLTEAQRNALVFSPGLSTAGKVSEISGRGVGMDVVRANVERIGGLVDLASREGEGLTLTLKVPLTLTIIPALTVGAGGESYAIPRSAIDEIVRVASGTVRIENVGGSRVATIRGERVPLACLAAVLGAGSALPEAECSLVVLRPAGSGAFALLVDRFFDHEELVVKPAAPAVMATGLYAGTTLGEDGRPMLLLDPAGIAADAGLRLGEKASADDDSEAAAESTPVLLLRTLAGARRAVPLTAIERILDVPAEAVAPSGGRFHVAVDGVILPLFGVDSAPEGQLRILRLTDGQSEIGYGFAEVIDIAALTGAIIPSAIPGEVRGLALVGADQVEILDLFWLFAQGTGGGSSEGLPVCTIPAGDSWMETFLRPIVESAGYRVVRSGEPGSEAAAVAILGEHCDAPSGSGRFVRLTASPESGAGAIHRYDRAALLGALAARS
jgi:two-component system chemotaxis sensor kinase CheA